MFSKVRLSDVEQTGGLLAVAVLVSVALVVACGSLVWAHTDQASPLDSPATPGEMAVARPD